MAQGRLTKPTALLDVDLLDALLERRFDEGHIRQMTRRWCAENCVTETALRHLQESGHCGTNPDSQAAAKNSFQLGVELREPPPAPPEPVTVTIRNKLPDLEELEEAALKARGGDELARITDTDLARCLKTRDWLLSDSDWCEQNSVSVRVLERIAVETYGLHPEPRVAATTAFEVAIEARRLCVPRRAARGKPA